MRILLYSTLLLSIVFISCKNRTNIPTDADITPKGVNILSTDGVNYQVKTDIDNSLTTLFEDAKRQGYTNYLDYDKYTIVVKDDCILSQSGTLSFKIRADDYDGTEFDQYNPNGYLVKDGRGEILAAEQVLTNGSELSSTYLICNADTPLVTETTRYGAEHIILYNNNKQEYERTKFHCTGIGHPIIPIN